MDTYIYKVKGELASKTYYQTLNFLMDNPKVILTSIKITMIYDVSFKIKGTEEEIRETLACLSSPYNFTIKKIKRRKIKNARKNNKEIFP